MQIPSYPVYRWFFIHCLRDSLGAAVLRPVASLCHCNCVQLLVVFLACSGGSQTLAFRKKRFILGFPVSPAGNLPWPICFTIHESRSLHSLKSPQLLAFGGFLLYFANRVVDQLRWKVGVYITYMKMGSTTISFLLLPDESRRIRFVTSIAGLFSPHLF